MENSTSAKRNRLYVGGLALIFIVSFSYIFDSKLDLNGDNCNYFMLATSLVQGHGYANLMSADYTPSNLFPPGYPLLMSIVRLFTDSIFPQKILNGLFLLGSSFLLFFFIRRNKLPDSVAFVAAAAMLLNYQVLHFATMMMSEMSFLFTSVLTCWFLAKMDEKKAFWRDPFFYLVVVTAAFNYHIRTQGIALFAAVAGYFLFTRRWKEMLGFIAGFAVCLSPWMLRNNLLGLGQSRYLDMIASANNWRPEEGVLGFGEIIGRFFDTFRMLLTKALPNSVLPYMDVNYDVATTVGEWCVALVLLSLIVIGMWRLGKYKYLFLFYMIATFGVISLFSTPSGNRYTTPLLPFLEASLLIGLYTVLSAGIQKLKIAKGFPAWILALFFLFCSYPKMQELRTINKMAYPPNYQHFFKIAEEVHKQLPPETVVCSRKPELFYMFSRTPSVMYAWSNDDKTLIEDLIRSHTDYVVLEQLGFSSTYRYLYPAIQKHPELFPVVMHLKNPDTYLLKFEREKAKEKFNK